MDRQTGGQTDEGPLDLQTDRQTYGWIDRWTDKETDRQADCLCHGSVKCFLSVPPGRLAAGERFKAACWEGAGDLLRNSETFSLIASLPPGGRHKVEVWGGRGQREGVAGENGDESASLDLFLLIELTCLKSSHLEFPAVASQSLFHPVQLGSRRSQGVFFFF